MTQSVSDQSFQEDVLESKLPVLVDFWAQWCSPCKQLTPIIDELSKSYEGKIKIVKMDIEENPETPSKYEVRGIPNLILFKNGEVLDSKVGSLPKAALTQWIDSQIEE